MMKELNLWKWVLLVDSLIFVSIAIVFLWLHMYWMITIVGGGLCFSVGTLLQDFLHYHTGDNKIILQIRKRMREDPLVILFDENLDIYDPVAVEIFMYEADNYVDDYMKMYEGYRYKFQNPNLYENLVLTKKKEVRELLRESIELVRREDPEGDNNESKNE